MPFFTIVVPTYNRAHLIPKTLNSMLAQTFQDFEIIIVDDGSTDDTEKVVQAFLSERVHYFKKENEERAVARNFGTQKALGEYVCWFDSDDIMYSDHLDSVFQALQRLHFPEAIHTAYNITNSEGKVLYTAQSKSSTANQQLITGNFLSCNSVFLKRNIALANPFNENRRLIASEDWELWLRIAAQYPIYSIPKKTFALINHDERSVLTTDQTKLLDRFEQVQQSIKNQPLVVQFLGKRIHHFEAECLSYVALHLALTGKNKRSALNYFLKSILKSPAYLLKRRSWATLKHLMLSTGQ